MGFAGRNFDGHQPLWKQTVLRWATDAPEKFQRWQELVAIHTAAGKETKEAERDAWREVSID